MIRKVYGIALVLGLALSLGGGGPIGCGDDGAGGGGKAGSGGSGGSGGTGGIGGSAGCPGMQSCGRVLDCSCVAATCNEDTGAWECPAGYPLDRCPSQSECDQIEDNGVYCDCSAERLPGGKKRGLGGCCVADQANDDCAPGYVCFNGYCSTPCDSNEDCGGGTHAPQGPSPFAENSTLSCVATSAGKWCLAGSADECSAPDDCAEGEVCTFIMSDSQDGSGSNRCMAAYCTEGAKPLGEACDPNEPYDCQAPTTIAGGQLFPGCFSGRCSAGCDPNDTASCGEELTCLAVLTTNAGEKTAGICGGADCGFAENLGQFTEPREERIEQDACPEGEWCDLGVYVGTGQQLMCTPNDPEGTQLAGQDCQLDAKLGQVCAEGYCIINLPDEGTKSCRTTANCPGENEICIDSDGNRVAHCTEAGPPGECGLLCANDGDCQEGAYCMRYQNIFQVGNRLEGIRAGICARPEHWYGDNLDELVVCTSEQDCTKTGDSCNYQWVRSAFALCGIAADGDRAGKACEDDNDCSGDLRCAFVLNAAQTAYEGHCTDLSDLKSVGEPCTAHEECKSQACLDSELRDPQGGRRTFCGSACTTSAQCGENMACRTLQRSDNSTAPTGDDSLAGYCLPRGPSSASNACEVEGDCKVGLCEAATGQCYDPEAAIGDVCRGDDECPMGAICEDEDRVCVIPGCDPAAETPCPAGSVCAKGRGPVYNCVAE